MGKHISHYFVDLRLPPEERWRPLLASRWVRKESRKLAQDSFSMFFNSPLTRQIGKLLKRITHLAFNIIGTGELDYARDVHIWGEVIGDKSMASMANLSYELYGLINVPFNRLGLCSSVAFFRPRLGMVHVRNMDWDISRIRKDTILVDFDGLAGKFTAVTMPGFCGVLSGVAKGRFSATINANEDHTKKYWPNFHGWGASFLLRWIFEYCESYEDALRVLRRGQALFPFLFNSWARSEAKRVSWP